MRMVVQVSIGCRFRYSILLEKQLLAESYHEYRNSARSNACSDAMAKLDPKCWRIQVNIHSIVQTVVGSFPMGIIPSVKFFSSLQTRLLEPTGEIYCHAMES